MKIRKAVIPVAGLGTRMLPAAKAVPKEMLPILDRPVIQWVIEEAVAAGIESVLLVTSRGKRAIEDHFDRDAELESRLAASGRSSMLSSLRTLSERVKIHSVRQPQQRGLGDAVLQARQFVGDEPFLCMLGDAIFLGEISAAKQIVGVSATYQRPVVGLEKVPADKVDRYGIVAGQRVQDDIIRIDSVIEKPAPAVAPSNLAIAARYVLPPEIFECLQQIAPGKGGEVQLTDAISLLLQRQSLLGVVLQAQRFDTGDPLDWLKTNLAAAARDEELWRQLRPWLSDLIA